MSKKIVVVTQKVDEIEELDFAIEILKQYDYKYEIKTCRKSGKPDTYYLVRDADCHDPKNIVTVE